MDFPLPKKYTVEEALALGKAHAQIVDNPEYATLMRSILNEFERDTDEALLEFLRAYVLHLPPEAENQVIIWISNPNDPDNPLKDTLSLWNKTILIDY